MTWRWCMLSSESFTFGMCQNLCIVASCSLSISDLQNILYAPPFPLNIKDQLLLICQWCEFFLLVCTWNSWCHWVKFQHANFSTGAHWKAHPKMETELLGFVCLGFFKRFRRARHLHTNFQLSSYIVQRRKVMLGCMHLEMHCMNHSIAILKSVSTVDSNSWFRPCSKVFLYHILFQECCKV